MTTSPPHVVINPHNDFKSLLGSDWDKLHPEIQARFSLEHCHQRVTYRGIMHQVVMSFAGRLLGNFCRLLGTPLSYDAGINVPTDVHVYPNQHLGGTTWDRYYFFPNHRTNRVRSTKVILPDCGLIEIALSGFGMRSQVTVEKGALVFSSKRFFFTVWHWRIPIPHWLSPGHTVATQRALRKGEFEFTLKIEHHWLGVVFEQRGTFREIIRSHQ